MQMLSNNPEVQIGSKVYQISPKSAFGSQKFFNSGYCISVGNLIVHSKSSKHIKTSTQQLSQTIQSKQSKPNQKPHSVKSKGHQRNLANAIKVMNSFVNLPKQKQDDELMFINSYLERKNDDISKQFANFVESFEVMDKPEKKILNLQASERSNLVSVFTKLQEKKKRKEQKKLILSYKRKRPPQLEASSAFQNNNFLSHKNSVDQKTQNRERVSSSSSAPQFNVLSYLNPNSSSTNIMRPRDISSLSTNNLAIKRLDDSLIVLLQRTKNALDTYKARQALLIQQKQALKHEVEYWKAMYHSKD